MTIRQEQNTKEEHLRDKVAEQNEDVSKVWLWLLVIEEWYGYKGLRQYSFGSCELEQIGSVDKLCPQPSVSDPLFCCAVHDILFHGVGKNLRGNAILFDKW